MKLYTSDKIEVRKSNIHGFGVFAKTDINIGEVLEECNYVKLSGWSGEDIEAYQFSWPTSPDEFKYNTIPFGFACVYNSADSRDTRNTSWYCDEERDVYVFKTTRNVSADTELLTFYGDVYVKLIGNNFKKI
jgi:hypothetical protein